MDILALQTGYTSIKMPTALAEKIKSVANDEGYRSVSEFVMEATRMRLKDFKKV